MARFEVFVPRNVRVSVNSGSVQTRPSSGCAPEARDPGALREVELLQGQLSTEREVHKQEVRANGGGSSRAARISSREVNIAGALLPKTF